MKVGRTEVFDSTASRMSLLTSESFRIMLESVNGQIRCSLFELKVLSPSSLHVEHEKAPENCFMLDTIALAGRSFVHNNRVALDLMVSPETLTAIPMKHSSM